MIIVALVQLMLDVGLRRVSQPPPTQTKSWLVVTALLPVLPNTHGEHKTNTNERKQAQDPFLGGVGGTRQTTSRQCQPMTPFFTQSVSQAPKGAQFEPYRREKELKRVDGGQLNQTKSEMRPCNKPTHLPPSHHDAKHPNCQRNAAGPRMDGKNRFRKLQREQNSTNERTNASKLDEPRRNSTTATNEQNKNALILH